MKENVNVNRGNRVRAGYAGRWSYRNYSRHLGQFKCWPAFLVLLLALPSAAAQTTQAQCASAVAAPSTQLATGISVTSYSDIIPVDGAIYAYVVTANNGMSGFSCSNIITGITIPGTGTHTVALTWTASSTPGVTYAVFRAANPANPSGLAAVVN